MKKTPIFFFSLLLTLLLFGCEKEDVSLAQPCEPAFPLAAVTDTCFSAPTMFGFSNYPGSPTDIDVFAVNPNSGSQLAVISNFHYEPQATFRVFDLCQGQPASVAVWENMPGAPRRLDWSKAGWILTYHRELNSWVRFHPESGQLVELKRNEFFSKASWLTDSTIVINENIISGQRSRTYTQIRDWNGIILDTIPKYFSNFSIRNELVFGYGGYSTDTLTIYDTRHKTLTSLIEIPREDSFHHYSWINDEELWLVRRDGIYRFNILTLELTLLKDTSCDNYYYLSAVPHPDDPNLLYVNRKDHRYGPEGYIRFRETINLLDINTLEEQEIQFFE
jgi:hypothetical protein